MTERTEGIVYVVDDDDSTRNALVRMVRFAGFPVSGFACAADFMLAERAAGPAVLLLDLEMPVTDGLALQQALLRDGALMPIVFMSGYGSIPRAVRAMKNGAVEFLVKPIDATALVAALDHALARARAAVQLSEREQAVLSGVLAGRLNKQIAAELSLSERTIKLCRSTLMSKLGAHSLADLVRRGGELVRH